MTKQQITPNRADSSRGTNQLAASTGRFFISSNTSPGVAKTFTRRAATEVEALDRVWSYFGKFKEGVYITNAIAWSDDPLDTWVIFDEDISVRTLSSNDGAGFFGTDA